MKYSDFLSSKSKSVIKSGFIASNIDSRLFEFQREIVKTAIECGKYAVFADCGLGKTLMQIEWARRVIKKFGGSVLILCPLAVSLQTINEGLKLDTKIKRIGDGGQGIFITNYEQIENIDASDYIGVVLDESSILKNFTGKTRNLIIERFRATAYKLCCTATPSPNDPMELGNHAEFLGQCTFHEMLAEYFTHDGGETQKWRIKKHAVKAFYAWVSTWATMINKPSDMGYSDDGYILPALTHDRYVIDTPNADADTTLFDISTVDATTYNAHLRDTVNERMGCAAAIAREQDGPVLIWCKINDDADVLRKLLPEAVEVRGSDTVEQKEQRLFDFAQGKIKYLITKPKICQYGMNFQNCHAQIFASPDYSFESTYQAIRRSWRFGQKLPVKIHMIATRKTESIVGIFERKQAQFIEMQNSMVRHFKSGIKKQVRSTMQKAETIDNEYYKIINGDCVAEIKNIPDASVDFSVFSPPFANLYVYSDHIEDMGNVSDYAQFVEHFKYLVTELKRVIVPGRLVAVHCCDLPIQKGREGFIGLRDFSGMIRSMFEGVGFIYHSRVTIWKDPVVEMQRTKALGLLHKQVKKDSAMSRVGLPDYLLVFRDDRPAAKPIKNTEMPVDMWQKYASPVWMDIDYSDTLQFRSGKDGSDEKHICPLQLPTIHRAIMLWTNQGDTVLTPFMGIGSEVYQAVKNGRKAIGIELKKSYFDLAKRNCESAIALRDQTNIFDFVS